MASELILRCFGHNNVLSTHKTTLEFTTEESLTLKGDCILGVKTTKSLAEFPSEIKDMIRKEGSQIRVILSIKGEIEEIIGRGHPLLSLSDPHAIIIRKSTYVCPRTLMIGANKAAKDISRKIVNLMKNPDNELTIKIQIFDGDTTRSKQA